MGMTGRRVGRRERNERRVLTTTFVGLLLLANPPLLLVVNDYARQSPLTFGWPTLWVYMWFLTAITLLVWLWAAARARLWASPGGNADVDTVEEVD